LDGNRHRPSALCGDDLAQQPGPPAHELIWPLSTRSLRRGAKVVALTLGLPLAPRDYLLRSAIQSVRIRAVGARADRRRVGRAGLLALQLLHDAEPPPDVSGRKVLLTTPGALNDPTIFTPDFGAWLRS